MIKSSTLHKTWQEQGLLQQQQQSPAHTILSLRSWQKTALTHFLQNAFPGRRDEEWKYTAVAQITETHFDMPTLSSAGPVPSLHFISDAYRVVFVDGLFQASLSHLPKQVVVAETLHQLKDAVWHSYLSLDIQYETAFSQLNAALLTGGIFIIVPEECVLEEPIHCIYYQSANDQPVMQHFRHFIFANAHSKVTFVEEYIGEGAYFNNIVMKIFAARGATVAHYKLQNESRSAQHIANTVVELACDSVVSSYVVSLGACLNRDNLNFNLCEKNVTCHLYGLYLPFGTQLIDHHTRVDHRASHGLSQQKYKGIIAEKGRAVFNGKVHVHPNAQKTSAFQNNQNILLDLESEVNTKPELEIYADDVQCTHGATVGQLEENALFYLRSRGIEEGFARRMLMCGFAEEIVLQISRSSIADHFQRKITQQLEALS